MAKGTSRSSSKQARAGSRNRGSSPTFSTRTGSLWRQRRSPSPLRLQAGGAAPVKLAADRRRPPGQGRRAGHRLFIPNRDDWVATCRPPSTASRSPSRSAFAEAHRGFVTANDISKSDRVRTTARSAGNEPRAWTSRPLPLRFKNRVWQKYRTQDPVLAVEQPRQGRGKTEESIADASPMLVQYGCPVISVHPEEQQRISNVTPL